MKKLNKKNTSLISEMEWLVKYLFCPFRLKLHDMKWMDIFFFFLLIHVGCPGQLTRTTTIPHGPLDIRQAQEQVKHRGGDRR
jgi:hypothetical protein